MIRLSLVDTLLILLYFFAVLFIGYRAGKRRKEMSDDFLLGGRILTLPMFVATLVSTWYGGILGVGEFSYRHGISNWIVFGVPYYIFALFFALFLAKKIRATEFLTIPDKLAAAYDKKTAVVGGVLTFVLVTPAAYILMLGILLQLLFGFPLGISVALAAFVTTVYLFRGGFRSDVWVNAFEFVMMFLGFALMVIFAVNRFGGVDFLIHNVPELHLTWHGGNSWQYIGVWFFIALWTLVDPAFHQRCSAAKDGKTAQRGILVSILFWFCFDFLTTATGLYARAALPDLAQPMFSYPLLAERILPSVAKGLFFIGLLATIMSTLSSLMFISAATVGNDIVARMTRSGNRDATIRRWTQWGLVIGGVVAAGFALALPSVVSIWYTIGTTVIPGLLVPVLAGYFERLKITTAYAFGAMIAGWLTSSASLAYGMLFEENGTPGYWFGIEPMIPGLLVSLAFWGCGIIAMRRSKGTAPQGLR